MATVSQLFFALLCSLFMLIPQISAAQSLTIDVSEDRFQVDEDNGLIVSHIEEIETYSDLSAFTDVMLNMDEWTLSFENTPQGLFYSSSYEVSDGVEQYTLYFTSLPIVSIETPNEIIDDPKVLAHFTYSDHEQIVSLPIGIELRGGSTQGYPKKTYDIEFWEDGEEQESVDVKFGDLRSDDDWILDALYNEPMRLRSYVATKLWLDIHTPYYLSSEPKARSGADVEYVEVFINGLYNGIYNISEQVDRKQLKLKDFDGSIHGELYKGINWGAATTYSSAPPYENDSRFWAGYSLKYPKEEDATEWRHLYEFTDFVINSSNEDFDHCVWQRFEQGNFIDYFIFLNLIRATDNTGKNVFMAKYDSQGPYFQVPWDLDGCFGMIWNGNLQFITDDILSNHFYTRVMASDHAMHSEKLKARWTELRASVLSSSDLYARVEEQYDLLLENKIYEREEVVYPTVNYDEAQLTYVLNWLDARLTYLDGYFSSDTIFSGLEQLQPQTLLYPNPARDEVYLDGFCSEDSDEYLILDLAGRCVEKKIFNGRSITVGHLESGNYFILFNGEVYELVVH